MPVHRADVEDHVLQHLSEHEAEAMISAFSKLLREMDAPARVPVAAGE
jgi:hypothetical protein